MARFGMGCDASRRWMADCSEAGRPGRGGAVPDRGGGAVPDRGGGAVPARGPCGRPLGGCMGCDMAGEPARRMLGTTGGGAWYSSRILELE
jgi:hypothetical protein